jgi:1,4-alpha-glucan branching enzyme
LNVNPAPKEGWQIDVTKPYRKEIFNSDDTAFWGTGNYRNNSIECNQINNDNKEESNDLRYLLKVNLPPLSAVILK